MPVDSSVEDLAANVGGCHGQTIPVVRQIAVEIAMMAVSLFQLLFG